MSAILKFDFQKSKQLRKLSKLHKKDSILHVTTTFFLKQGETRTNSVPISHPLIGAFSSHASLNLCFQISQALFTLLQFMTS